MMAALKCAAVASSVIWLLFAATTVSATKSKSGQARFLLVSSPSKGNVMYAALKHTGGLRADVQMQPLVNRTDKLLQQPLGIAVDQVNQRLFIADPALGHILGYKLRRSRDPNFLGVDSPTTYATGVKVRWVAVDGLGNLYYTDEDKNQILRITAAQVKLNGTSEVLYDGSSNEQLRAPGGIGVDSFKVYWVNKQQGTQSGSILRAPKAPTPGLDALAAVVPETLAKNTDKSYGVCLATKNVFYTQPERQLFGVPKTGDGVGGFTTISDRLKNPRGCVYDGDGTMYVADRGAGAVYSFAGASAELAPSQATKFVQVEDAFGVALFSGARQTQSSALPLCVFLAVLVLAVVTAL